MSNRCLFRPYIKFRQLVHYVLFDIHSICNRVHVNTECLDMTLYDGLLKAHLGRCIVLQYGRNSHLLLEGLKATLW